MCHNFRAFNLEIMIQTQSLIRIVEASTRRLRIRSVGAPNRCVKAVRSYLERSYPNPNIATVLQIIRRSGVDRIPLELLVGGTIGDASPAGAAQLLERATRAEPLGYGDPYPLFASSFYGWENPDVVASGVAPWVHYQVFGHREARSPHPFLDASFMRQWIPAASPSSVVDTYLSCPEYWTIDTSPYVDTQRFVLESETDGINPPIMRILGTDFGDQWLSLRLMLIDASSPETSVARLNAAAFLLSKHSAISWQRRLVSWSKRREPLVTPVSGGRFTVVPGYFLGAEGATLASFGEAAVSPDSTVVRLDSEYISLTEPIWSEADRLVFVASELDRDEAEKLFAPVNGTQMIAPRSSTQEAALVTLISFLQLDYVNVLPFGRQSNVESRAILLVDYPATPVEVWDWTSRLDGEAVIFVLPQGALLSDKVVALMEEWISRGSSLLTTDAEGLGVWYRLLGRARVVVHPDLLEGARLIVARGSLQILDENRRS